MDEFEFKIRECLGDVDNIFAGHVSEENDAEALLEEAADMGVSKDTIVGAFWECLKSQDVTDEHLLKEMRKISEFFDSLPSYGEKGRAK